MELPHEELMKDIQISTATSSNSWLSSAMSQPCSSAYYYTDESDNESVDLYYDDAELSLAQPIGPFVQEGPDSGLTLYVDDKEPSTTNIRPAYYRDWDEITYDHEFISPTAADFPLHTIIENSSSGELDPPSNFTVDPFLQGGAGSKTTSSKDDHEPISITIPTYNRENDRHLSEQELTPSHPIDFALHTIIEYARIDQDLSSTVASSDSKPSTSEVFPESSQINRKKEGDHSLKQKKSAEHIEAALKSIASFCNREEVLAEIVRQYKENQALINRHPRNTATSPRKKGKEEINQLITDIPTAITSSRKKGKEKKLMADIPTSITVPRSSVPKSTQSVSERAGCRLYEQALLRRRRLGLKAREASSLQYGTPSLNHATRKPYTRTVPRRSCRGRYTSSKTDEKVESPLSRRKMQASSDIKNEHVSIPSKSQDILKCFENGVFDRLYNAQKKMKKK
uniref:Uncharacterized protein n=1 Tax=Chaetoceros debilis TaxID=122233 RepID=A0A7S3Q5L0_9STRA